MSFDPMAGSAGRLASVALAPDLALPVPTVGSAVTAAAAGITGFKISISVEDGGGLTHYESPSYPTGPLATEQVQGGISKWSAEVSGTWNGDAADRTPARFANGAFVVADFVYSKASTLGRYGNVGKVKSYQESFDHKANNVTFTCTLEGHGLLTDSTIPA
jgi:hypothetical protein